MNEDARKNMSREERLAAKLRENLRRRKAQSRAAAAASPQASCESEPTQPLPNPGDDG